MFFSLLYLFALASMLILTILSIRALFQNKPVMPLLIGMTGIAVFYLIITMVSVWME